MSLHDYLQSVGEVLEEANPEDFVRRQLADIFHSFNSKPQTAWVNTLTTLGETAYSNAVDGNMPGNILAKIPAKVKGYFTKKRVNKVLGQVKTNSAEALELWRAEMRKKIDALTTYLNSRCGEPKIYGRFDPDIKRDLQSLRHIEKALVDNQKSNMESAIEMITPFFELDEEDQAAIAKEAAKDSDMGGMPGMFPGMMPNGIHPSVWQSMQMNQPVAPSQDAIKLGLKQMGLDDAAIEEVLAKGGQAGMMVEQ